MNFVKKPSARASKSHARCSDEYTSVLPAPMNTCNGTEWLGSDAAGPPDTRASRQHFRPYRGRERDIRARRAGAETFLGQEPGAAVRSCPGTGSAPGPPLPAPGTPTPPLPAPGAPALLCPSPRSPSPAAPSPAAASHSVRPRRVPHSD